MAVLVEAISIIVRRPAIAERFEGGWPAFQDVIPNATGCYDADLVRVGFMHPADAEAFLSVLDKFIVERAPWKLASLPKLRLRKSRWAKQQPR